MGSWGGGLGTGDGQFGGSIDGITVDSAGYVYVIDKNDRVQKFDSNGTFITKWGSSGSGDGQFGTAVGIVTDSANNVYVADMSGNSRIQKFDSNGTFITKWGSSGSGNGQFTQLGGITIDSAGNLLVVDDTRVQKFDTNGTYISQWSFSGQNCTTCSIEVDQSDKVYLSDEDEVKQYSSSGTPLGTIGGYGYGVAQYHRPKGIAISANNEVLVVDGYKGLVHRYPQPIPDDFSQTSSRFICETTYHFRAFAINSDGTGYGADQTFTTGSCAGATVPSAPLNLRLGTPYAYSFFAFLNWDEPEDFGGKAISEYILEYKKSSDSTWLVAGNQPGVSGLISDLDPATSYDFRVAATNEIGTGSYSQIFTTSTFTSGGSYTISECAELHIMDRDPYGTFSLAQDIDCAGYSDFTQEQSDIIGVEGYLPIGVFISYSDGNFGFQGILNGNNHKITNLKISDETGIYNLYGLFGFTSGATISNVHLENLDFDITSQACGEIVGGLVAYAFDTTFDNVSTSGNIDASVTQPSCGPSYGYTSARVGGIVGTAQTGNTINKSFSSVTINATNNTNDPFSIGGLVGVSTPQGGKEALGLYTNNKLSKNMTAGHLQDISLGPDGNIYGVNTDSEKVQKFSNSGTLLAEWRGQDSDYGRFITPKGITVGLSGDVYLADTGNNRILRFDSGGNFISAWGWGVDDGSNAYQVCTSVCTTGYVGYGDGQLYGVTGVTVDSSGNVYAGSVGGKIHKFDSTGNFITSWYLDLDGASTEWYTRDMAIDSLGSIYASAYNDGFQRIQKFDSTGNIIDTWDLTGVYNNEISNMSISTDQLNNLYLADARSNRIQKFDSAGNVLDEWGSIGADSGEFYYNTGVTNDSLGNIFVADTGNNRIQKFDSTGNVLDEWTTDTNIPQRSIGYDDQIALQLTNTYFNGNITLGGNNTPSSSYSSVGGLLGVDFMGTNISNSYVAGNIVVNNNSGKAIVAGTSPQFTAGMDLWGYAVEDATLENSFVTASLTNGSSSIQGFPDEALALPLGSVIYDNSYLGNYTRVTNNYFDKTTTNNNNCLYGASMINMTFGMSTNDNECAGVNSNNSNPNYFKFNRLNPPFNQWNFGTAGNNWQDSVWRTNYNGLPTFGINTPPDPPVLSTGVPDTVSIPVSWTPPTEVGGRPIIDYLLQYRVQGASVWNTYPHAPSTATNYTLTGLSSGTTYEIQVAAINEIGASQFVLGVTATTTTEVPPNPPEDPKLCLRNCTFNPPSVTNEPVSSPPVTESPTDSSPGGLELPERPNLAIGKEQHEKIPKWVNMIPFFFLSLLLLIALMYALKSWKEYKRVQALKALINRYHLTSQNIQAFLQISAHYLNTPVAIMQNAMELFMSKQTLPESVSKVVYDKLKELGQYVASVQNSAQNALSLDSSSSATVGTIDYPKNKSLLSSKEIWLPLISVALALAVLDCLIVFTGGYRFAELRLLNHILFFGLGVVVLVIAVYLHNRQKELHQEQKQLVATEQSLHEQQTVLLGSTGEALNRYYSSLSKSSEEFRHISETKVYFNGLAMLGRLSNSLSFAQSLVMIQDNLPQQSLSQTIEGVLSELQPQIDQKQITLVKDISPDAVIQALPEHASYLVKSLLENAVKFGPDNNTIRLNATTANKGTLLRVVDHGQGITQEQLDRLFSPFSRGTSNEVYDTEGLGLGLYNSKLLVEQLSGKLTFSQTKPNGVTVDVNLPKLKDQVIGQFGQTIRPS